LWHVVRRRRWTALSAVPLLAGSVALGAGIAALQLAATAELLGQSIRSGGLSLDQAATFSLPLRGVVGNLLPDYTAEHQAEFAGSVGAAALALIALALATRWRQPRVGLWALLGIVALAAALGPRGGVYTVLFHVLPGLSLFRVPARLLLFTSVGAAVLAGEGTVAAQQLASAWERGRRRVVARVLGAAGALSAVPALALLAAAGAGRGRGGIWAVFPQPVQAETLALLAAFPTLVLLLVLAGLRLRGRPTWAIPAVVAVDLALLAGHTYPLNPLPEQLYQAPATASVLVPADQDRRFLSLVGASNQLAVGSEVPAGLSAQDRA